MQATPIGVRFYYFFGLVAVVVFSGICIYLELRIATARADLTRLRGTLTIARMQLPQSLPQEPDVTGGVAAEPIQVKGGRGAWTQSGIKTAVRTYKPPAVSPHGLDAKLLDAVRYQMRARHRFNALYDVLGMSDEEIENFETSMAEMKVTFSQTLESDRSIVESHGSAQIKLLERVVQAALGVEYVEPFRLYAETSDLRDATAELVGYSQGSAEPINSDQASALLQICRECRYETNSGGIIRLDEIDWELVANKSADMLTSRQQELLRAIIDRRNFGKTFKETTGLPLHRPIRGLRTQ